MRGTGCRVGVVVTIRVAETFSTDHLQLYSTTVMCAQLYYRCTQVVPGYIINCVTCYVLLCVQYSVYTVDTCR